MLKASATTLLGQPRLNIVVELKDESQFWLSEEHLWQESVDVVNSIESKSNLF